jgi:hypothetical protein
MVGPPSFDGAGQSLVSQFSAGARSFGIESGTVRLRARERPRRDTSTRSVFWRRSTEDPPRRLHHTGRSRLRTRGAASRPRGLRGHRYRRHGVTANHRLNNHCLNNICCHKYPQFVGLSRLDISRQRAYDILCYCGFYRRKTGANWVRPGRLKCGWRAVVGQLATLKADQYLHLPKVTLLWLPK